ncbi:MAG TPA: GNAT family N-acetyltransferase [Chitinophagaceae bacterium]|nr:GNAT family N-acetyltransferase [Chitinophagaceae bacterium]
MITRLAEQKDLPAIVEIYNQAIKTKISTAETILVSVSDKQYWFEEHANKKCPLLVAEKNKEIVGWISLSPYRKGRQALEQTAEISYYVHNRYHRKGTGSLLMQTMIDRAKQLGYENLIAIIMSPNTASAGLLKKFRFEKWGLMPGVIKMDDKIYDHLYYGLKL